MTDILGLQLATDPNITGLTADSRKVKPGYLFAALPGAKADGRAFVAQAIAQGAVAILAPEGTEIDTGAAQMVTHANPRRAFARAAAAFYGVQPQIIAAVTGTNGKTSIANFARQIWQVLGAKSAALGTLGVIAQGWPHQGSLTTPDPADLHATLADLAGFGVTHACMEASSHGLDQYRLDGVTLKAAAFSNLTRDHLDYHRDMASYWAAKRRLFTEVLPADGWIIANADAPEAADLAAIAAERGQTLLSYGRAGEQIRLMDAKPEADGQTLSLSVMGHALTVRLPLAGTFQVANALAALGLVIAGGADPVQAAQALEKLEGVPGRLQQVGTRRNGAPIYVDYAHTPDALETVLNALRPHTSGRLVVVFGCGGDRDPGKRPQMGAIAERLADLAIVTDDNPRSEEPAAIRRAILAAAPAAMEIGDRATAIAHAVAGLKAGDVLVLAGKGHESGQIVGATMLPFDDAEEARKAIALTDAPLWSAAEAQSATAGTLSGPDWAAFGVSIDSRSVDKGDLFIAIAGPNHDGHDYVKAAIEGGAAAAMVHRIPEGCDGLPLLLVDDTMAGLQALGAASRARSSARIVAVTGSVGKTGSKEMLALALSRQGLTHHSVGSFNNHWGVPLSLARMPRDVRFAVFELGMNHAGEITPLTRMVRPHVAIITTVEAVHVAHFTSTEQIADAKAEIFDGLEPGGVAVLNRDNRHFRRLADAAKAAGVTNILSFGSHIDAEARLLDCAVDPASTAIFALLKDHPVAYRLGVPGLHWAMNSLAVVLAVGALGGDADLAARSLAAMAPPKGRGERHRVKLAGGTVEIIDESYNASPVSMKAAIATLAAAKPAKGARRLAVLGDMLELGEAGPALHAGIAESIIAWGIDAVHTAGPLMQSLMTALPPERRGLWTVNSEELAAAIKAQIKAGDVVVVKGSAGSRMGRVVKALLEEGC